jgi:hypothetical protein
MAPLPAHEPGDLAGRRDRHDGTDLGAVSAHQRDRIGRILGGAGATGEKGEQGAVWDPWHHLAAPIVRHGRRV